MKVNRVFCYSQEAAKKSGNKLPILELIMTIIIGGSILVILIVTTNSTISILALILWTLLIIYYSANISDGLRNKLIGYATDTEGRIFKVKAMNNGQGLYFGGTAAGGMIDQLVGDDSGLYESIGSIVGATAQLYSINRSAKYMSNPEIVAKMVESAPNVTGAEITEILKVYSVKNRREYIKVNCDYKILRKNKIKYKKNLIIKKTFNMFDDLVNMLNSHR